MAIEYVLKVEQTVCPQCKILDLILEAVPEITGIAKVNIDNELTGELREYFGDTKNFIDHFGIMGTPTLLFLDDEFTELGRIVGARTNPGQIRNMYDELGG